jgi:hypothetical protein
MYAAKYAEHIIEKAKYLQRSLKFCTSSEATYEFYIYLEDIVHIAERLRELCRKA